MKKKNLSAKKKIHNFYFKKLNNPRIKKNTGLSMIDIEFWDEGNIIEVQLGDNKITEGIINNIPFS